MVGFVEVREDDVAVKEVSVKKSNNQSNLSSQHTITYK